MTGLAFGLMGDMMHAGNPWRGMLYGMTTRFRCADPQPIWQACRRHHLSCLRPPLDLLF